MADDATNTRAATPIGPKMTLIGGKPYLMDAKGTWVPQEAVKAKHLLEDELVRKVLGYAVPLAAEVARFREHTFDDVDQLVDLLAQEHGCKRGGIKGNQSFTTFDGCNKVQVAVADQISFGAELQIAKALLDECVTEWAADGRAEVRAIINRVFNVEQAGMINRAELVGLLRLEIEDERWQRAMGAIRESMRVIGSKRYVRIYRRNSPTSAWEAVSIDVASA